MKHLLLLSAGLIAGGYSYAQKTCDLTPTVITPASNTVFNYGDTLRLTFSIKNNGSAAIVPTDTIYYAISPFGLLAYTTGRSIASGASVTVNGLTGGNDNQSGKADTFNVCIRLINQSMVPAGGLATITYNDPTSSNDQSCNRSIIFKPKPLGILDLNDDVAKENLKLYPNPSSDEVMFDITLEKPAIVTAVVRDITGREVMKEAFGKVQSGDGLKLNIAALNAGLYIVEVTIGDRKAIGKVTKQH